MTEEGGAACLGLLVVDGSIEIAILTEGNDGDDVCHWLTDMCVEEIEANRNMRETDPDISLRVECVAAGLERIARKLRARFLNDEWLAAHKEEIK